MTFFQVFLWCFLATFVTGCGGGGGSSGGSNGSSIDSGTATNGNISLDKNKLTFTQEQGQSATAQYVTVNFKGDGVMVGYAPGVTQPSWLQIEPQATTSTSVVFRVLINQLAPLGGSSTSVRFITGKQDATQVQYVDLPINLTVAQPSTNPNLATTCASDESTVFVDAVCSFWRKPSIMESDAITHTGYEITNTNVGKGLTYDIIDTKDPAHRQVFDINYANQTAVNNEVTFYSPASATNAVDMSAYATGKVIFDINVINEGTAGANIEFAIICGWPCGTTPYIIKPAALNKWQTVEISVADMVSRGLKLTQVTTGFSLVPNWGKQANVHYQVDNIRWVKGSSSQPTTSICYANYLDALWISGVQGSGAGVISTDTNVNVSKINIVGINPASIQPDFRANRGKFTIEISQAINYATGQFLTPSTLSSCSGAGVLSMDVYLPKRYVDDGKLQFSLSFIDTDGKIYEIPNSTVLASNLKANDWNRMSVALSSSTLHANLKFVGLNVDSSFINAEINDEFKIDNIIITQPFMGASLSSANSVSNKSLSSASSKAVSSAANSKTSSINNSSTNSTAKSLSSVSSSPSINTTCASYDGAVFVDGTCSPWRNPSILEINSISNTSREITDTNTGEGLTYNIINSNDAAHHQVFDIHYADQSTVNSEVNFYPPTSSGGRVDMSAYATGKLIFDINVIHQGTAGADIEFNIECGWPCGTTPYIIKPTALNKWQTVEISVADMVSRGLKLTQVSTGFLLLPSWGKQANVHYQVDNIRWVKGTGALPTNKMCYANFLDSLWVAGVQGSGGTVLTTDTNVNVSKVVITGINAVATIRPDWRSNRGRVTVGLSEAISYTTGQFLTPSTLSSCSGSGVLSMDVFMPKRYVDDAKLQLSLSFIDENGNIYTIPNSVVSAANLKANDWNRVSVALSPNTLHTNLKYVGLNLDSSFINAEINDEFRIDNIVIQ